MYVVVTLAKAHNSEIVKKNMRASLFWICLTNIMLMPQGMFSCRVCSAFPKWSYVHVRRHYQHCINGFQHLCLQQWPAIIWRKWEQTGSRCIAQTVSRSVTSHLIIAGQLEARLFLHRHYSRRIPNDFAACTLRHAYIWTSHLFLASSISVLISARALPRRLHSLPRRKLLRCKLQEAPKRKKKFSGIISGSRRENGYRRVWVWKK